MISQEVFLNNLAVVKQRISDACAACGRNPQEVTLLPVTKNWPVDAVKHCVSSGIKRVGENRVQEAAIKQEQSEGVDWELIGHLQSNKVNQVVGRFARIQTLDSLKLIRKVQAAADKINHPMAILLQVNAGNDPAKYGFKIEESAFALDEILKSSHLLIEGLMTIAPYSPEDPSVARKCFDQLAGLRESLQESHGVSLDELSMGMSDDLVHAIAAGSTMIRVGSALFGSRK